MALYWYAKADQMEDHDFTDDVALTRALSKRRALSKFRHYYDDVEDKDVYRVKIGWLKDIVVLTDY